MTDRQNKQDKKCCGIQRVLAKLEASLARGDYYEAHQMYRTLYFRYVTQEKYDEVINLLFKGSKLLLEHDQHASGSDLAILLLDVLVKSETQSSEEYFKKLTELFSLMTPETTEREMFLNHALHWGDNSPFLHKAIANVFWKEKNYVLARYHFLHSRDGTGFATLLVEQHRARGYANEVDLFIAQVVLQFLCLQNKHTASVTFHCYTTMHPAIDNGPPYILPLLNFIFFLLEAIESGKLTAFTVLCEQYQPSIKRDPSYPEYLDKIAQIFFGAPPPQQPSSGGLFGNLLQSLMNGMGDQLDSIDITSRPSTSRGMTSDALD